MQEETKMHRQSHHHHPHPRNHNHHGDETMTPGRKAMNNKSSKNGSSSSSSSGSNYYYNADNYLADNSDKLSENRGGGFYPRIDLDVPTTSSRSGRRDQHVNKQLDESDGSLLLSPSSSSNNVSTSNNRPQHEQNYDDHDEDDDNDIQALLLKLENHNFDDDDDNVDNNREEDYIRTNDGHVTKKTQHKSNTNTNSSSSSKHYGSYRSLRSTATTECCNTPSQQSSYATLSSYVSPSQQQGLLLLSASSSSFLSPPSGRNDRSITLTTGHTSNNSIFASPPLSSSRNQDNSIRSMGSFVVDSPSSSLRLDGATDGVVRCNDTPSNGTTTTAPSTSTTYPRRGSLPHSYGGNSTNNNGGDGIVRSSVQATNDRYSRPRRASMTHIDTHSQQLLGRLSMLDESTAERFDSNTSSTNVTNEHDQSQAHQPPSQKQRNEPVGNSSETTNVQKNSNSNNNNTGGARSFSSVMQSNRGMSCRDLGRRNDITGSAGRRPGTFRSVSFSNRSEVHRPSTTTTAMSTATSFSPRQSSNKSHTRATTASSGVRPPSRASSISTSTVSGPSSSSPTIQGTEPIVHVKNLMLSDRRKCGGHTGNYNGTISRKSGLPHGSGRLELNDDGSSYYKGEFMNGEWHGSAKYVNSIGDIFLGSFKHNFPSSGTWTYKDGRTFQGDCNRRGMISDGCMTYPDGATYEGCFRRNKRHGEGIYEYTDGSVYSGEFRNDLMEGEGELIWPTGERYEGSWLNGKPDGFGREYEEDGETLRFEGLWHEGQMVTHTTM